METRICKNCKKDFIIESDDFAFYKKLGVSAPTWCPHCRFIRKMTFINERSLYKRNCDHCNEFMISMYHPDTPLPVWCVKCNISDELEGLDYGRDYDFSKSFFEQLKELKFSVPHRSLAQNFKNGINCEYANMCFTSKNAYLSFNVHHSENIKYSKYVLKNNKNCLDSLIILENDRGYELIQAEKNYNSSFLIESDQCIESHFLFNCSNCVNCFMSTNLRNKSNIFRNIQLTKEEYKKAIASLELEKYSGQVKAREEFEEMKLKSIHKYANIKNSINVIGDFIENSKNIYHCYGLIDAENMKYVFFGVNTTKDSQDLIFTGKTEQSYELTYGGGGTSRVVLSSNCGGGSKNLFYSFFCRDCSDCFGCVDLRKKQYCIFNKQYTKEEYFEVIEKIKKHMDDMPYVDKIGRKYGFGEYFPTELSPFAYNETVAFEQNPLSKEEVLKQGYKWKEMEAKLYTPTIKGEQISDSINDVSDSICDEIIECPNKGKVEYQCTSAFKILPDELSFYRQMSLPIPRYCPNCRYHQRLKWINFFNFYHRQCMCNLSTHNHKGRCEIEFETMYAPDRPETIYCKQCYQDEFL